MLEKQGFGVVRSGSSLFQAEYEGNIYGGFPVYVTTDAAYNSWHLVFDKTLRDLEQKVLLPKLEPARRAPRCRRAHAAGGRARRHAAGRPGLQASSSSTRSRPPSSGRRSRSGRCAKAEKALIDAHDRTHDLADRRHQRRLLALHAARPLHADAGADAVLRRDVRARPDAVLPAGDDELPGRRSRRGWGSSPRSRWPATRRRSALWQQIYEPTAFLVGLADDYTPEEVARRGQEGGSGGARTRGPQVPERRRRGRQDRGRARREPARCGSTRSAPRSGSWARGSSPTSSCSTSSSTRTSAPPHEAAHCCPPPSISPPRSAVEVRRRR